MQKLKVILAIAIMALMVVPAASFGFGGHYNHGYAYYISNLPEIYLKGTNGSANLTYAEIALYENGTYYSANMNNIRWTTSEINSTDFIYAGQVRFFPVFGFFESMLLSRMLGQKPPQQSHTSPFYFGGRNIPHPEASVQIQITRSSIHNIFGLNVTNRSQYGAYSITFSMKSSTIAGSGTLGLFQVIGASRPGGKIDLNSNNGIKYITGANSSGLAVNSNDIDASYWWNNTYTLNGHSANVTYAHRPLGPFSLVVLRYNYTNGIQSLIQDPYFASPQFNFLIEHFPVKVIRESELFLVDHIQLLVAGLITGGAVLGFTYAGFRAGPGRSPEKRYKIRRK